MDFHPSRVVVDSVDSCLRMEGGNPINKIKQSFQAQIFFSMVFMGDEIVTSKESPPGCDLILSGCSISMNVR